MKIKENEIITKGEVWVGMGFDMLIYLYGKPTGGNISDYGTGKQYQFCWSNRIPSCFYEDNGDGFVDAYN
jgi:hypothetical protein